MASGRAANFFVTFFTAFVGCLTFACGPTPPPSPSPSPRAAGVRLAIELSQRDKVFALAAALFGETTVDARWREMAAAATGALLASFVDDGGAPLLSANGIRLRGTCGVTFIAPSYAVTASHCVDGTRMDLENLVVEMYRPTPLIASAFLDATALTGSFPDFTHARLGENDGHFTDRYPCSLVSRCAGLFGGAVNCDGAYSRPSPESDTALIRCEGAPGLKYGFVESAAADDPAAEPFMPWKHEIYDIATGARDPNDDRWSHYVALAGGFASAGAPAILAANYHYFGSDPNGVEQNQLLSLVSVKHLDGTPRRKLSATAFAVSTDLLGCHGTSGSGVLQQGPSGDWQLLGPVAAGNLEHNAFLCNHVPALDGSSRAPGTLGLSYMALEATRHLYARNAADIAADCRSLAAGASRVFTHGHCLRQGMAHVADNAAFIATLAQPRGPAVWDIFRGPVNALAAGQAVTISGLQAVGPGPHRVGLNVWSTAGCPSGQGCPRVSVTLAGREILSHAFDTAPDVPVPIAATFAVGTAEAATSTLSLAVENGEGFELSALTVQPEAAVIRFDTSVERLSAVLVDLAALPLLPRPMRFAGDGRDGFAAWLLPNERMVMTGQALSPGRRWTARFTAIPSAELTCGLLDQVGQVVGQADCSTGLVTIDDTRSAGDARAGFFIQTSARGSASSIDDIQIVSDAAPDSDGDTIPDLIDPCPLGPQPVSGTLQVVLPDRARVSVCSPEPAIVAVAPPRVVNACDKPTLAGRLTSVNGKAVGGGDATAVTLSTVAGAGAILLPLGSHILTWQVRDGAAHVYATVTQNVSVVEDEGAHCCAAQQQLTTGGSADDAITPSLGTGACALAGAGDDLVVGGADNDWLWGASGDDYLAGGGGADVLSGGDGADYLRGGAGGTLAVYAGPGDDTVHATATDRARIFGGAGADFIVGGGGPDEIFPGPGGGAVDGGSGDDTITVYATCELVRGTRFHGGPGIDTLVTPVPGDVLTAMGISWDDFENIVVDASRGHLSECF